MTRRLKRNIFTGVLVVLIICGITIIVNRYRKISNVRIDRDVKANMLLIQGVCKVKKSRYNVSKKSEEFVGVKISDKLDDEIIKKFISDLNIPNEDYEKYYILYDEDLKKLELNIKNEEDSLYIINYDIGEVYITKAYNGKHRLSEIDE